MTTTPTAPLVTATGDREHPGTRVKRIRLQTIQRIEARRRRRGPRWPWNAELDEVINAGLIALGEEPLFPPETTPAEIAAAEIAAAEQAS